MLRQACCSYPGSTHWDTSACQNQYLSASCLSDSKPVLHMLHSAKKLCTSRWIAADWFLSGRLIAFMKCMRTPMPNILRFIQQAQTLFLPKLTPVYCCQYSCNRKRSNYIVLHSFSSNQDHMHFLPLPLRKKIQNNAMAFFMCLWMKVTKNPQLPSEAVLYCLKQVIIFLCFIAWICTNTFKQDELVAMYKRSNS